MAKLYQIVCDLDFLYRAWRDVRVGALRSSWPHLAEESGAFDEAPLSGLQEIRCALIKETYTFAPKVGYTKRKSGGSRRGITVHSLSDRIVQRAILNLLVSTEPEITAELGDVPSVLRTPTSAAGLPHRGVPYAIALATAGLRAGASAFACSDIKDFFPRLPRAEVIAYLSTQVRDEALVSLFASALETEMFNLQEIDPWRHLFPVGAVGVPQGGLLSVLVGNLALREFDERLNRVALMVRYLDDFLILAETADEVNEAFALAQRELARLDMTCYTPGDGSHKAWAGNVARGFDFLGCTIHPDGVAPARAVRRKLLREVAATLAEAKRTMLTYRDPLCRRRNERSYAQVIVAIDAKLRGWGDAFAFVSNRVTFAQLDEQINRLLNGFRAWAETELARVGASQRQRMVGVALLADTPPAAAPRIKAGHSPQSRPLGNRKANGGPAGSTRSP